MAGVLPNNLSAATDLTIWEDDPACGVFTTALIPNVEQEPFGFSFPEPQPAPSNDVSSAAFRYWTAAEALKRGADFWGPKVPVPHWQRGAVLEVHLDRWEDLRADYDRRALNFYHGPSAPVGKVYSCASADVVCHEVGHAILDAIKPSLWTATFKEVAAFHETFGDMSAILCALQLPSLRQSILMETGGHLCCDSRLSRIAEQFGTAVHAHYPNDADPNCLRNASKFFCYCNPSTLPSSAPTTQLSSDPHSFSRIFTGALFEALADMLTTCAANPYAPSSSELLGVSLQMRDIIVAGVRRTQIVPSYFAQMATAMVLESAEKNPDYFEIFMGAFVRRSILSLETASAIQASQQSLQSEFDDVEETVQSSELTMVSIPASHYGLVEDLNVETAFSSPRFLALGAERDNRSMEPVSPLAATAAFVDELFASGQVDYNGFGNRGFRSYGRRRSKTHELVSEDDGLRLQRRLFT